MHHATVLARLPRAARLPLIAAILAALLVPSTASARLDDVPAEEMQDAGSACLNLGSGAAFMPQTSASIVARGGTLSGSSLPFGMEVAGVLVAQDGASLDALGNRDNVGSGAVMLPQTPFSIFAHGGVLADPLTRPISVAGVQVGAEIAAGRP